MSYVESIFIVTSQRLRGMHHVDDMQNTEQHNELPTAYHNMVLGAGVAASRNTLLLQDLRRAYLQARRKSMSNEFQRRAPKPAYLHVECSLGRVPEVQANASQLRSMRHSVAKHLWRMKL